jgi:hypothetical protein
LPWLIVDAVAQQHKLAIRTTDAAHEIWLAEYQISGYVIGARSANFFGFGNAAIVCFILRGFVSICGFLATN